MVLRQLQSRLPQVFAALDPILEVVNELDVVLALATDIDRIAFEIDPAAFDQYARGLHDLLLQLTPPATYPAASRTSMLAH